MKAKLEALENRLLLATVTVSGTGTLTIATSENVDVIDVSVVSGNYKIDTTENGVFTTRNVAVAGIIFINVQPGGGSDNVDMNTVGVPVQIFGGNGNDVLVGGSSNDTIQGGNGNDNINGNLGNDRLDGGVGADTLRGGGGIDTADYSGRSAAVTADLADDKDDGEAGELDQIIDCTSIMGGSGNDRLTGDALGNYLSGGAGNDTLVGDLGNDVLVGGAGVDAMFGNDGADAIFALDGEIDVVDGGPGSDSAQTDPAEGAPVPGEDAVIPAPSDPLSTFVGPVYSAEYTASLFSRKPVKRQAPARRPVLGKATVSAQPVLAPAAPVPGGPAGFDGDAPKDIEEPITQETLLKLAQILAPYAYGQAIVTRNFKGEVTIGGTDGDDDIVIETAGDAGGPHVNIMVNGGLTEFLLPTPFLELDNDGGKDSLTLAGSEKDSGLIFAPSRELGQGRFTLDGHEIDFNPSNAFFSAINILNLSQFRFVTPFPQDRIQLSGPSPNQPDFQGTTLFANSGQLLLPAVQLTNVGFLLLDTGTNETFGDNFDDHIIVNNLGPDAPALSLITVNPANPDAQGSDELVVNGGLKLANDPTNRQQTPTLIVSVPERGSYVEFQSELTRLASLRLGPGGAATLTEGNHTLYVRELEMVAGPVGEGSILNIFDGNLIVEHDFFSQVPQVVRELITMAYNPDGRTHWNAPGILSHLANRDPSTGIGYAESSDLFGRFGGPFGGVEVDDSATLVSFTLLGDTNLDKTVDFKDLVNLAQNYGGREEQRWFTGDFNYDFATNFSDLVLLAQNYGKTLLV
jgi:hypothetical protein